MGHGIMCASGGAGRVCTTTTRWLSQLAASEFVRIKESGSIVMEMFRHCCWWDVLLR